MDEPLSNLDAKLRVQMRAEISRLQDELGTTTLYVTHDQIEAMTMGDRVAVLHAGVLQQYDRPNGLYENPANLFVAGFMGSPPMNLCVADVDRQGDTITVRFGSNELKLPPERLENYPRVADYEGRQVALGLRPESFFRQSASGDEQRISGEVNLVEVLGAEALVHVSTDAAPVVSELLLDTTEDPDALAGIQHEGVSMITRADPRRLPQRNERVDIPVAADELHIFDLETGDALR
jgi:multiple sugar transport system ATP-binding protein